jgi:four helix bundle protein
MSGPGRDTGVSRTLANQLLRSGTSIGANVEESQAAQSRADFLNKLSIARKEARETHYWLRLLAASDIVHEPRLTELLDEADQLIAILTAITKRIRNSEL